MIGAAPSLPWFLAAMVVVILALCAMWWLGMHYERRNYDFTTDPELRLAMWQDGYNQAMRDMQRETQILDEADRYIGELRADDFTDGVPGTDVLVYRQRPGELDITSRDPNDSLAERLTSTGELAMLSGHLQAATFLDMLEGWPDRVLAEIWGANAALAAVPNGAHHHE